MKADCRRASCERRGTRASAAAAISRLQLAAWARPARRLGAASACRSAAAGTAGRCRCRRRSSARTSDGKWGLCCSCSRGTNAATWQGSCASAARCACGQAGRQAGAAEPARGLIVCVALGPAPAADQAGRRRSRRRRPPGRRAAPAPPGRRCARWRGPHLGQVLLADAPDGGLARDQLLPRALHADAQRADDAQARDHDAPPGQLRRALEDVQAGGVAGKVPHQLPGAARQPHRLRPVAQRAPAMAGLVGHQAQYAPRKPAARSGRAGALARSGQVNHARRVRNNATAAAAASYRIAAWAQARPAPSRTPSLPSSCLPAGPGAGAPRSRALITQASRQHAQRPAPRQLANYRGASRAVSTARSLALRCALR
jgi:hypothetical protein